jgi:hypothetical protein
MSETLNISIPKIRKQRSDKGQSRKSPSPSEPLATGMAAMGPFIPRSEPLADTPHSGVELVGVPIVSRGDIEHYRKLFGEQAEKGSRGVLNPENFITPDPTKNYRFCSNRVGSGTGHSFAKNNRKWGFTEVIDPKTGSPINVMGMTLCERPLAAHIVREEMKTGLALDQIAKADAKNIAATEALRANLPASTVAVLENTRTVESSTPQPVTL